MSSGGLFGRRMSFETVLSTEHIYEGRLLNLRVDQVRTARGVESVREIVEHPGAVAVTPIDEYGRVRAGAAVSARRARGDGGGAGRHPAAG